MQVQTNYKQNIVLA